MDKHLMPSIRQHFNKELLSFPVPKFRHDSQNLIKWFQKAIQLMEKKTRSGRNKIDYSFAIQEFKVIYERIVEKEKELEAKDENFSKRSFCYFQSLDKKSEEILRRFGCW